MEGPRRSLLSRTLAYALKRWGARLSVQERRVIRDRLSELCDLDCDAYGIKLVADSDLERERRANSCAKEPMTIAWLRAELRPGDVFYDVGANVGPYSLVAAKVAGGKVTVYAFEPSFQNYHQLCRNVILNGCEASVVPVPIALCERTRLDVFHYQNLEPGGALHSFSRAVDYKAEAFEPKASLLILGLRLDEFVRIPGVARPNILKIDVDGLEPEILEGAQDLIRDERLRTILMEINEDLTSAGGMLEVLRDAGLAPVEKHHLTRSLHNYIFRRQPGAIPFSAPVDVPLASRRGPVRS